ncbi:MAG: membrane protein insertase YidC [Deltaproteobacteria bacterium]|jgi:YidC/Oxa1 family membrane protein insertase|nr:membrane protein insertase YidC [Deltaproteobacteria bacterium]
MEKRFLVTMLVMTAFFIAVSYLYPILYPAPPRTAAPSPAVQNPAASPAAVQSPASGPAAVQPAPVQPPAASGLVPASPPAPADPWNFSPAPDSPAFPPRDIEVRTADITAVFTESGGRLKSLTLNKYLKDKINPRAPDSPQEMVNVQAGYDLPLGLWLAPIPGDSRVSLAGLRFEADRTSLNVEPGGTGTLTLTARTAAGLTVTRILTFRGEGYLVNQTLKLTNEGSFTYQGRLGQSLPVVSYSFRPTRYGAVAGFINRKLFNEAPSGAAKELASIQGAQGIQADWLGYMDQHFLNAFVFENGNPGASPGGGQEFSPGGGLFLGAESLPENGGFRLYQSRPVLLPPGTSAVYAESFYSGPKNSADLQAAGFSLDRSLDYGWFTFLAIPLIWLLRLFYQLCGNYGLAIILVTIIIKAALWPLTAKSYKSMKEMQKIQPLMAKIREKYKDDRETMQKETIQLYKTYKVSPLGGCLPMLLQIPFFIAFYRVLDYALELRGAPFMLWITDLSAPDRLFYFAVKLPLLDAPTGIPVLTILMGATMIWQQKMTPSMGDPMQAKIMMLMPLVFIFILLNMPSGLVLYWLVNNILSIFQQKLINRPAKPPQDGRPAKASQGGGRV